MLYNTEIRAQCEDKAWNLQASRTFVIWEAENQKNVAI